VQLGDAPESSVSEQEIVASARALLSSGAIGLNDTSCQQIGRQTLSFVRLPLRSSGETSHLVVGCRRANFPTTSRGSCSMRRRPGRGRFAGSAPAE